MKSRGLGYCCVAYEVGAFGGGEYFNDPSDEKPVVALLGDLLDLVRTMKRSGASVVIATTMSNQPNAAKALTQAGFHTSGPFSNSSGREMQVWFLPLVEFNG